MKTWEVTFWDESVSVTLEMRGDYNFVVAYAEKLAPVFGGEFYVEELKK